MTVNKFGNYLYIKSQEHRLAAPSVLQKIKEPSLKSICFFTLKGNYREDSVYYLFENGSISYQFKISGTIQNLDITNSSILISINQEDPIKIISLIGRTINKGDIIKIIRDVSQPLSENIFIEVVMLCSLIQDE